jgi:thiol-disulfide isomerase/thioredoxin
LQRAGGGTQRLAALRGHPVLLNFWGVSCPPCRREAPLLQQAYERYRAQGLIVLGLDAQGDDGQSVAAFAAERGLTYPMLLGASEVGGAAYGVTDLPVSFLVDRQGIVREASLSPFLDAGPLQEALRKIL